MSGQTRKRLLFAGFLLICGLVAVLLAPRAPKLVLTLKGIETNQAAITASMEQMSDLFATNHFVAMVSVVVSNATPHDLNVSTWPSPSGVGDSRYLAASHSEVFRLWFPKERPWQVYAVGHGRMIYAGKNRLRIAMRGYVERYISSDSALVRTLDIP